MFLNVDLDEKIYMQQPVCFITPGQENKVCKLRKSIYSLKQSSIKTVVHQVSQCYHFLWLSDDRGGSLCVLEAIKEELCHSLLVCG